MYASISTVRGSVAAMDEVGRMAGEAMQGWLADLDGFRGLMILTDEQGECARVMTLWETREAMERSRATRLSMRDKLVATVGMRVDGENEEFTVAMLELLDR